jgi:transcriptional regulator NrdR family protein
MTDIRHCIECPAIIQSEVTDCRPPTGAKAGTFRRRRVCPQCGARWNTLEVSEERYDRLILIDTLADALREALALSPSR